MASRSSVVLSAFVVASLLLAAAEVHASAPKVGVDIELDGREMKPGTEKDATVDTTGGWPPGTSYPTIPFPRRTPPRN